MVAADADGVPSGQVARGVFDGVHHEPHRGFHREDVLVLRGVLLEDVVLDGASKRLGWDAALFGGGDVHGPEDGCGRVDGHGRGNPVHRYAVEEYLHVRKGGDGHAALAELAHRGRVVGVVAVQRGHVERDTQAGLALLEQVLEPLVGVLGGAEPGEHAHGPQPAAVAGGVDAAQERVLAGHVGLARLALAVVRRVGALDGDAGHGGETLFAFGGGRRGRGGAVRVVGFGSHWGRSSRWLKGWSGAILSREGRGDGKQR